MHGIVVAEESECKMFSSQYGCVAGHRVHVFERSRFCLNMSRGGCILHAIFKGAVDTCNWKRGDKIRAPGLVRRIFEHSDQRMWSHKIVARESGAVRENYFAAADTCGL